MPLILALRSQRLDRSLSSRPTWSADRVPGLIKLQGNISEKNISERDRAWERTMVISYLRKMGREGGPRALDCFVSPFLSWERTTERCLEPGPGPSLGLPDSRIMRYQFLLFISRQACGILLQQPRWLKTDLKGVHPCVWCRCQGSTGVESTQNKSQMKNYLSASPELQTHPPSHFPPFLGWSRSVSRSFSPWSFPKTYWLGMTAATSQMLIAETLVSFWSLSFPLPVICSLSISPVGSYIRRLPACLMEQEPDSLLSVSLVLSCAHLRLSSESWRDPKVRLSQTNRDNQDHNS